jgi:hypothetical protein
MKAFRLGVHRESSVAVAAQILESLIFLRRGGIHESLVITTGAAH